MASHIALHVRGVVWEFSPPNTTKYAQPAATKTTDVFLPGNASFTLEIKAIYADALLLQAELCEQFHYLISRQIMFRRKEIR